MKYSWHANFTGITPPEWFLGRRIRTRLDLVRPKVPSLIPEIHSPPEKIRCFALSDDVLIKNEYRGKEKWIPGRVAKVLGSRCYLINIQEKALSNDT